MAKVRTEHREKLLELGVWGEFVAYRDKLKYEGINDKPVGSAKANKLAVAKFLGVEAAEFAGESLPVADPEADKARRKARRRKKSSGVGGEGVESKGVVSVGAGGSSRVSEVEGSKDGEALEVGELGEGVMVGEVPPPPGAVPLSLFRGKGRVGEIKNITWVCDYLCVRERSAEALARICPSLRAWNLLRECREKPLFRANFWRDQYGKTIPSKSQLGDDEQERRQADGDSQIAMAEKLLELKTRSEAQG